MHVLARCATSVTLLRAPAAVSEAHMNDDCYLFARDVDVEAARVAAERLRAARENVRTLETGGAVVRLALDDADLADADDVRQYLRARCATIVDASLTGADSLSDRQRND